MRHGLTLFEVGVSLLIVGMAISTVLALFPVGLKAQQESRFRLLASAQLSAMVANIAERKDILFGEEGLRRGDRPFTNNQSHMPDFDAAGWMMHAVLHPLPPSIAQRLDSDHDEIATLLAEGGQIFYPSLGSAASGDIWDAEARPPPEMYRLVIGIIGAPQQNALLFHPQIKWPYHEYHPVNLPGWTGGHRAELSTLVELRDRDSLGTPWWDDARSETPSRLLAALKIIGLDFDVLAPPAPDPVPDLPTLAELEAEYATDSLCFTVRSLLLRYAAFHLGRACSTVNGGFASAWPDANLTVRRFQIAQRLQQAYQTYLQTHQPYDLSVPRDYHFQIFTDYPLLQFDLTAPPLVDPSTGSGIMHAWSLMSSRPLTVYGTHTYGRDHNANGGLDLGGRGSTNGWNLTARFDPSERAREVVMWAVDWQAYADAEVVPSAPMDAGQLPRLPHDNVGTTWTNPYVVTHRWGYNSAPPEMRLHWRSAARVDTSGRIGGASVLFHQHYMSGPTGQENSLASYLGCFGADRNGNGRFDIGPLDPSVRLRATTITRFVVYDPRGFILER